MDHNLNPQNVIEEKLSPKKSVILIVFYFLMFFVGATVLSISFAAVSNATEVYSEKQQVIDQLQLTYSISYMDKDSFLEFTEDEVKNIDYYVLANDQYYFLTSKGLLKETDEIDLLLFFTEKDLTISSELLSQKIDRVGYKDNSEFLNTYSITNPVFEITTEHKTIFTSTASILLNFIIYIITSAVLIGLTYKVLFLEFKELPKVLETIGIVVLSVLIMYAANVVSNLISVFIKLATNDNSITSINQFSIVRQFSSKYSFLAIITITLLAPLVEELIFRKAFFSAIKNQWLALAISSLVFGLIHVTSEKSFLLLITNIIPYLISGVALGFIYIKNKRNIWPSIFAHMLINAISVLLIILL